MTGTRAGPEGAPAGAQACGNIFRLRDLPMAPRRGIYRGVHWMHFEATVQLRIPLRGAEWNGVKPEAFHVKVSEQEIIAKCTSFYVMDELNLQFRHEVDPDKCWCCLERDITDDTSRSKVLLVEVAKRRPGEAWDRRVLSSRSPPRSPEELKMFFEVDQKSWKSLPLRCWRDEADEYVTCREKLCRELETGQTEESVHLRVHLSSAGWKEALEKAPQCKIWALDISKRYVRLFIRGDRAKPVLFGKLPGNCAPDKCYLQLSTVDVSEAGLMEDAPCLDLIIVKADDSYFDWGREPLDFGVSDSALDEEPPGAGGDSGDLDLAGGSPGEWMQEMRARAAEAFRSGDYDTAVEYYTRLLQCTPGSEKLLSNRSVAYLKAQKFQLSLDDALKAQQIAPGFPKVYFRKGQALHGLNRLKEAIASFREGMAIDGEDTPEWKREIVKVKHTQRDIKAKQDAWI